MENESSKKKRFEPYKARNKMCGGIWCYEEPTEESEAKYILPPFERVLIVEEKNGWCRIESNGLWIHKTHLM